MWIYNKYLMVVVTFLFLLSACSSSLKEEAKKRGYLDNEDGTVTHIKTGLMWTQKDSWADRGSCISWNDAKSYVADLETGGYSDWRMPILDELEVIFDKSVNNIMGAKYKDFRSKHPLHMDKIFSDGAAYMYWSSESAPRQGVAAVHFGLGQDFGGDFGFMYILDRDNCSHEGVRAVRK